MKRNEYMPIVLRDFEEWYKNDPHRKHEDYYLDTLTKENLISMSKEDFKKIFYNFVKDGGKVQSGGNRTKNRFKNEILEQNYDEFKRYVLKPFENGFDVEEWLFNESFKYFTKGIATIYLNRIDKDKYSIFNNKTIDALKALEYDLSKSFKT